MEDDNRILMNDLNVLNEICDIVRFVDPINKNVIQFENGEVTNPELHCFDFWKNNRVCDNCISIRAYHDRKTYIKIEYLEEKTYLIIAIPINLPDRIVVLEILKETTQSMSVGINTENERQLAELHALIDHMNQLSSKDALTGIYNRRYIDEKLPVDLINCALLSEYIAVIMVDLDLFKNINDTYGHLSGDCMLKHVAQTLNSCIKRNSDWVARYGGEEFLICLPGAYLETAKEIAEMMRAAVEAGEWNCNGNQLHITASFGICCVKADRTQNIEDLIAIADKKMYEAKANGRNRVEY